MEDIPKKKFLEVRDWRTDTIFYTVEVTNKADYEIAQEAHKLSVIIDGEDFYVVKSWKDSR